MAETHRILLVDDEELVRKVMRAMLESFDFEVVEAANGQEGLDTFLKEAPDLVFTDLQMPVMDGLGLIAQLKEQSPDTPIIVVSGTGNVQSAIDAIRLGAWDYVTKPVEALECLDIAVRRVMERARLISENRAYQEHLEDIVIKRTSELRDSEARFRTLFRTANDAIIVMADGSIESCNLKTAELFGQDEAMILGRSLLDFSPALQPDGQPSEVVLGERMRLALSGAAQSFEWRGQHSNGNDIDVEISLNRLEVHGDLYLQAIMRDIAERKRAQQVLLDNMRIMRELEIAREIQQSLLPALPPVMPGIEVACRCVPAASVGGDYYDFFPLDGNTIDVIIADVAGHSVGSALLMAEARSVLQARVGAASTPARLLADANDVLYDDLCRAELQISMFCLRLDVTSRVLTYANAGHVRPLLCRFQGRTFEELDAEGMLLGVQQLVAFEERQLQLFAGDLLLLHTDGIAEAENPAGEFFGTERIIETMRTCHNASAEGLVAALLLQVGMFTGARAFSDDVSLAVIKLV